MGKAYPLAFRKRVVAAVESGGLSCNQAAKQFGIGISTAIGWVTGCARLGAWHRARWAVTNRRRFPVNTVSGSCSEPRMATSPCGGLSLSSASTD